METVLITFPKKVLVWGKWTNLDPKMTHPHNSGSTLRIFFDILHTERGQYADGNNLNDFYKRLFIQGKWSILDPKMAYRCNSGSALRIFLKILQNETG